MVPRAVLMKSGLVSLNTARQVNTAHLKITINSARPMTNLSKSAHSTVKWPIHKNTTFKNSNFNQRVNTVKNKNVNTVRPKAVVNAAQPKAVVNAVKASACWVWKPKTKIQVSDGLGPQKKLIFLSNMQGNPQMNLQDQGVIDSGCLRHMTKSMSYLTDYEEIDGRYNAFGGNPKGWKITGKVPRKNNMYSVDLKNIVPKGGLTCLFAKATSDESKLWHRRLGHINFKTMNKLVKGNLLHRQRSYANVRRKPLELQVGNRVMLKASPRKDIFRFGKRGKLNPRYIGPFKILERIDPVAYKLELPKKLSSIHISNLKKCLSDESFIIPIKEL
ncbi:putative ribonuclease H-like domain-containing protein [Tanacetum coccineum]